MGKYTQQLLALAMMATLMITVAMLLALVVNLVLAWPFMWLWNASAVVAFGLQPIGYWTSFWLLYLMAFFAVTTNVKVTANQSS